MAISLKKITKKLSLNLSKVPTNSRTRVKKDVGEFIVNEMLISMEKGDSPVQGENFPKLSGEYAVAEKDGDTTPNLDLEGDMLNSLKFDVTDRYDNWRSDKSQLAIEQRSVFLVEAY